MNIIWSQTRMLDLLQSMFEIVNVRVGFFDLDGKEIAAYPGNLTRFCTLIRTKREGDDACIRCDRAAYERVSKSRSTYIYRCHAGLIEMIAPITTSDDQLLGYLMIGQVRPAVGEEDSGDAMSSSLNELQLNADLLKRYYDELPMMRVSQVKASAKILQALAAYTWQDNYIYIQNKPLSGRVEDYIKGNVEKNLTLEHLCKVFGVSKTTLCNSLKNDLQTTASALILASRAEAARYLLQSTDLPISQVAERVGIHDYNYFTKVFKREVGTTPSMYRKLCESQHTDNW